LKEQCREKRTSGKQIKYIIKDSTSLEGVKLKEFLSHIETKRDLTTYLAEHVIDSLNKLKKDFVVVNQTKSVSNIEDYPIELLEHNHEEAVTLMILQAKTYMISTHFQKFISHLRILMYSYC